MRRVEMLIVVLLLMAAIAIPACVQKESKMTGDLLPPQAVPVQAGNFKTASGLAYQDIRQGTGVEP